MTEQDPNLNPDVNPNPNKVIETGPMVPEPEIIEYENVPEPEGKLYDSWTWITNEVGIGMWVPPTPMPAIDGVVVIWNEPDLSWYYRDEETNSWIKYIPE